MGSLKSAMLELLTQKSVDTTNGYFRPFDNSSFSGTPSASEEMCLTVPTIWKAASINHLCIFFPFNKCLLRAQSVPIVGTDHGETEVTRIWALVWRLSRLNGKDSQVNR